MEDYINQFFISIIYYVLGVCSGGPSSRIATRKISQIRIALGKVSSKC